MSKLWLPARALVVFVVTGQAFTVLYNFPLSPAARAGPLPVPRCRPPPAPDVRDSDRDPPQRASTNQDTRATARARHPTTELPAFNKIVIEHLERERRSRAFCRIGVKLARTVRYTNTLALYNPKYRLYTD